MINPDDVKWFWETRSEKLGKLPFESIANLEEKEDLLHLKVSLEQEKLMPLLSLTPQTNLLDLGAGVGQWSFRFAPRVQHVTAVEYIDSLAEIGRVETKKRGLNNVEFITSPAETFHTTQQFDVIFISGLFVYLSREQADQLMNHLLTFIKPDGVLLLRDGTSILSDAHQINNQYSSILNEYYSAYYRTRGQYTALFTNAGFQLIQDGQVFEEGSPLNKFTETRLWYYLFSPRAR